MIKLLYPHCGKLEITRIVESFLHINVTLVVRQHSNIDVPCTPKKRYHNEKIIFD
jgi:hypothetical protein